jgi:hypothetical protein
VPQNLTEEKIMTKKTIVVGSIVFATLLIFSMTACDNGSTGGTDTWEDVTSLSQLDGTWKGSYHYSGTAREYYVEMLGMTKEEWTSLGIGNDARITGTQETTYTINASAKTLTISSKQTVTISGSNMATYWASQKESLNSLSEAGYTVTVTDANHITMVYNYENGIIVHGITITLVFNPSKNTVTQTSTSTSSLTFDDDEEMLSSGLFSDVQINQNGTKIKITTGKEEEGTSSSLIYIKQ